MLQCLWALQKHAKKQVHAARKQYCNYYCFKTFILSGPNITDKLPDLRFHDIDDSTVEARGKFLWPHDFYTSMPQTTHKLHGLTALRFFENGPVATQREGTVAARVTSEA